MLIGWSPHQASKDRYQPAAYLLDKQVLKSVGTQRVLETRIPAPELLFGHPSVVQSAIAALPFTAIYRVALLSFDPSDVNVALFNDGHETARQTVAGAIDLFLELAFAGVPQTCRPPVFAGTHTHTGRLEINIVMPRFIRTQTGKLRSYNPHPPMRGSQNAFDALGDLLNAQFGWANPRAPERALAVKGPDWAEKRVSAAKRHGIQFTPDVAPKLFLLQAAQIIAASRHGRDLSGFLNVFRDVVAATDYELFLGQGKAITLVSPTDPHPFVLCGTSLAKRKAVPAETDPPATPESVLSKSWQRRASWNASEYSADTWAEPEPDWTHRVRFPKVTLRSCHPEAAIPVPGPRRLTRLADRLTAGLRRLRARVSCMAAQHRIGAGLSTIDLAPWRAIKNKLERMTHDAADPQIKRPERFDGGALRAASPRSGQPPRDSDGRGDTDAGRGDDRDQGGNGTAHRCAGPGCSHNQNGAAAGTKAADPVRRDDSDLSGYFLDQGAALARPLRAIDVLRAMSATAGQVLPGSKIDISMDHQGGFKVAGPDWEIAISRGREVSGAGKVSARSYHLFIDAMVGQLGTPLVEGAFRAEDDVDYAP